MRKEVHVAERARDAIAGRPAGRVRTAGDGKTGRGSRGRASLGLLLPKHARLWATTVVKAAISENTFFHVVIRIPPRSLPQFENAYLGD